MYQNKCTKCGVEFETKNPKRVICPACLYPDRNPIQLNSYKETVANPEPQQDSPSGLPQSEPQSPNNYSGDRPQGGGFNRGPQSGGYNRGPGGYDRPQGGGFNRGPQSGGFNNRGPGGYDRPQGGGFNRGPQSGGFNRRPGGSGGFNRGGQSGGFRRPAPKKNLLISREQLAQIEDLYKIMLPLPNPDAHEVIGTEITLESNKVFFGINLVRQKMMLPKLPFPKRKLAVSPDQLIAIENLYTPLLPLPPIGCHKFIAKQLKMDEWRVHVGIGIVRKQMELPRWNPDRDDAPEEFKNQKQQEETSVKE